jgi:hypothetical protein
MDDQGIDGEGGDLKGYSDTMNTLRRCLSGVPIERIFLKYDDLDDRIVAKIVIPENQYDAVTLREHADDFRRAAIQARIAVSVISSDNPENIYPTT